MRYFATTTTRLAATAVFTLGAAGAALALDTGSASATVQPNYSSCDRNGSGTCTNIKYDTTLWVPDKDPFAILLTGEQVEVTCWYPDTTGETADGIWDHVSWEASLGKVPGHVDDGAVNFNGHTPHQIGIPRCP